MNKAIAGAMVPWVFGASLALGFGVMPHAAAQGETVSHHVRPHQTAEVDYMSDGSRYESDDLGNESHEIIDPATHQWREVTESDPEWSCVDDGNRVCGPDNPEGVPPGQYDDGGVLVKPWPVVIA